MQIVLLYAAFIWPVWTALLHGNDLNLLATYETLGHDETLQWVRSSDFQPTDCSLLVSLQFRRPDIFAAQLSKLDADSIGRILLPMLHKANEHSHIAALEHIVKAAPEWLIMIFERAMSTSRLRIALWAYNKLQLAGIDFNFDPEESILSSYLFAFTELDKKTLMDWLRAKIIEDDDKLREELLLLCLEKKRLPSVFFHLMEHYYPAVIEHNFRLNMLIALIESGGSAGILPLIIGHVNEPSRLWLVYVEETEVGWRLLQHNRLDLVVGLIKDEFSKDSHERNYQRMKEALWDATVKWPNGLSLTCPIVQWLARWLSLNVNIRDFPCLGYIPVDGPIGQAAFDVALELFFKSGAFMNHLQMLTEQ